MRVWFVLVVALGAAAGCARVRPWQREDLARIEAQQGKAGSYRAYEAHMWMVREGAVGGSGQAGGGCGCN